MHHIGPATMHNLNKKESTTKSNEKLFTALEKVNIKKDVVMLVFGEIDCRLHIYHQYIKQREKHSISELIDKTIANFSEVLDKIKTKGVRLCILGIPAVGTEENKYNFEFFPTPEIQSQIYKEFNDRIKQFCDRKKYPYIDIYSKVSDERGFIKKGYLQKALSAEIFRQLR